jgi:hypothetical protein
MALVYTTIQHEFRKKHGLKIDEYTLTDMIYHLSVKPDSDVPGWCYMSKSTMSDELDLSRRTIINIINKLVKNGFLIRHEVTKHLKTTAKWQKVYFTPGAKFAHPVQRVEKDGEKIAHLVQNLPNNGAKVAQQPGAKVAHNNNTIYNYINNKRALSEIKISDVPSKHQFYFKIAKEFNELIIKNLDARRAPKKKQTAAKFITWVDPIRLMIEQDKVTREMLLEAYKYLKGPNSTFWKANILSTASLRKNITQLLAQANNSTAKVEVKDTKTAEKLSKYD